MAKYYVTISGLAQDSSFFSETISAETDEQLIDKVSEFFRSRDFKHVNRTGEIIPVYILADGRENRLDYFALTLEGLVKLPQNITWRTIVLQAAHELKFKVKNFDRHVLVEDQILVHDDLSLEKYFEAERGFRFDSIEHALWQKIHETLISFSKPGAYT